MSNQKKQEEYLRETKRQMQEKLKKHGVAITDATPFRAYVNGIDEAVANAKPSSSSEEMLRHKIERILSSEVYGFELTAEDMGGITIIRRYALYQNPSIVSVEVPETVTSIDPNAFNGCSMLETVRLPKKVRLQASCFANCTALKRVYLPAVTDASELPVLITDTVFPSFSDLPDCDFVVTDDKTAAIYGQNERWEAVTRGRFAIINNNLDEVTET